MSEITKDHQNMLDWFVHLRIKLPQMTPEELDKLLPVCNPLLVIIAKQQKSLEWHRLWAWTATATTLVTMAMFIFDLRWP